MLNDVYSARLSAPFGARAFIKIYPLEQSQLAKAEGIALSFAHGLTISPKFISFGHTADFAYILMDRIPGHTQNPIWDTKNIYVARSLIHLLHKDRPPSGINIVTAKDFLNFINAQIRSLRLRGFKLGDINIPHISSNISNKYLYRLCHNDVHVDNIIEHQGKSYLIDYSHCVVSHPAVDVGGIASHYKTAFVERLGRMYFRKGIRNKEIALFAMARSLRRLDYLEKTNTYGYLRNIQLNKVQQYSMLLRK